MSASTDYPIDAIRADFPMLKRPMNGRPLVYLDSAATTHKPQQVIDRLSRFYSEEYATVRRGAYSLSHASTALFEGVRAQTAAFFNAGRPEEIVFVRGVTEAVNLVATAIWSRLRPGDEVLVSTMEHHSNIVPWQLVAARAGAIVRPIPIDDRGELDLEALEGMLSEKTRLVSVVHVSNGLGTVNPVAEVARLAHSVGALCMVDGAQSAPHMVIDVQALGCDLFACSGHKMLGPTGVGVLWGRYDVLASLDPYQGGGEMIDVVTFAGTTFDDPPYRFEAGTPAFAQVVGFGAALSYLSALGMDRIADWDAHLLDYATAALDTVPGLRRIGTAAHRSGLVSFVIDGTHPADIGSILDQEGIAIRVGQHCVQPVMARFGLHSTARASFGVYTTTAEVDALVRGLHTARDILV